MLLLQVFINGILLGGLYACMAIGFSVIWGVMNIINLAHGSMILSGAYITYVLHAHLGLDPLLGLPVAGLTMFAVGFLLQRYLLNRVVQASVFMTLMVTFGLDMVLTNINLSIFSADLRSITPPYSGSGLEIGSIRISYPRLGVFVIAILLTLGLYWFMNRTRAGNAIKATSFDSEAAGLVGMNTAWVYSITFGIGAFMAGVTGSLVAVTQSFTPVVGASYTMKSFVIVVLGGLGSIPGAIVGGMILGVVENLTSIVLNPGLRDAVSFILLVVILVVRPRGIFGKRFYAEV